MDAVTFGPISTGTFGPAGKSFGPRAWAYVIDALCTCALAALAGFLGAFPVVIMLTILGSSTAGLGVDGPPAFVMGLFESVFYFVLFEWLCGATPGKLLLHMRVVKDGDGHCSLGAALGRGLARYIDGFFFALVAYSNMHPPEYKRLGDKWAHTMVVDVKDIPVERRRSKWWAALALALYVFLMASMYGGYLLITWLK